MRNSNSVNIESILFADDLDFLQPYLDDSDDLLVCTLLWESVSLHKWKHRLQSIVLSAKSASKTVILIINSWYRKHKQELTACGLDEVVFLDFFLALVYIRLIQNKESEIRSQWNADRTHFLFLTGKPNKQNRLPLLYRLSQENLLDVCNWSLFVTDRTLEQSKKYLIDLDEQSASTWLRKFSRNPDDIIISETDAGMHYGGIPYGNVYESCLFQLVSETSTDNSDPWITEKTWLSIINRCPFLIFGNPGSHEKLTKMGFQTFQEFLCNFNFDKSLSIAARIDSIVQNIRHWLDILPKNKQDISEIVEHNHRQLLKIANENLQQLEHMRQKYKIQKSIFDLVEFKDQIQCGQWYNWYDRIRDPKWPDCDREEDFHKLPEWIQKECIEVFNYKPKEQK